MDEQEYSRKYANLRILKSIQEYFKSEADAGTAVYPVRVPDDLLVQVLRSKGPEGVDELIHRIFQMGLRAWSERLYTKEFGSEENLLQFIELVKKRNRE